MSSLSLERPSPPISHCEKYAWTQKVGQDATSKVPFVWKTHLSGPWECLEWILNPLMEPILRTIV